MGIETKSPGMLIDELFTVNQKLWFAQENIMNSPEDSKEALQSAKKAQDLNAKRNKLIRAIDEQLGFGELSYTEKSYAKEEDK